MKHRVNNHVFVKEWVTMRCTHQVKTTLVPLNLKGFRLPTHLSRKRMRIWTWTGQRVVQMETQTVRRTLNLLLLDLSLALTALGISFFPSFGQSTILTWPLKEKTLTPYERDIRFLPTFPSVYLSSFLLLDLSLALTALGISFFPSFGQSTILTWPLKEKTLTPYERDIRFLPTFPSVYLSSLKSAITMVLMTSGCMSRCSR